MDNVVNDLHYGCHVFWWTEDHAWVARCVELPSISGIGKSPERALAEARYAVGLAVKSLQETDEPMPAVEPSNKPKMLQVKDYGQN